MKPVTYDTARFVFWDIESLANAFTVAFFDRMDQSLSIYYLVDPGTEVGNDLQNQPLDHQRVLTATLKANPAWAALWSEEETPILNLYNLATWEANDHLARIISLSDAQSVNDPASASSYPSWYRPVCDTDPEYDPTQHYYLCGYNSDSYDTTLMAVYLSKAMEPTQRWAQDPNLTPEQLYAYCRNSFDSRMASNPLTAAEIRRHNDNLFSEEFTRYMPAYLYRGEISDGMGVQSSPYLIRRAMINSGRHLDVARFNEKQMAVGLKRLLGMLGYQILESEHLSHNTTIHTMDEFIELIAYNVSDIVNLAHLFDHPVYSSGFDIKRTLMLDYPETVYKQNPHTSQPDIRPSQVRIDRLTPDSTSAKFVARILAPYQRLKDIPKVSFLYPSNQKAKELGIEQYDVLERARSTFYDTVSDPQARAAFDEVYAYYDSIRGKNFNNSKAYKEDYGHLEDTHTLNQDDGTAYQLPHIPKRATNIPYYTPDGTPTAAFATFSTGGIHGAETNQALYHADNAEVHELQELINTIVETLDIGHLPEDEQALAIRQHIRVSLPDGHVIPWRDVLMSKSSPDPKKGAFFKPLRPKEIFTTQDNGSNRLNPRYIYTSVGKTVHEDFSSYYPLLLTNLNAFYNKDLGEDRYAKLYAEKEELGAALKDPHLSEQQRALLTAKRNGVKLLLNAASGAGDTEYEGNPIRMNNMIISMRLIGQLITWGVAQAQAFAGASIPSTNTDGIYTSGLDFETNNKVLEAEAEKIKVLIEPEELYLVSKDSNNRIEIAPPPQEYDPDGNPLPIDPSKARIISASGGSLACYERPTPLNSLSHPAVIDRALATYLRSIALTDTFSIEKPIDPQVALEIMESIAGTYQGQLVEDFDSVETLLLFQNVVASSMKTLNFIFASDPVPAGKDPKEAAITNPRALQRYNRVFIVKPGTPHAVSLRTAGARKVSATSAQSRQKKGLPAVVRSDLIANQILLENGYAIDHLQAYQHQARLVPQDQDVTIRKVTGIEPHWHMLILNQDLMCMTEQERQKLINQLDLEIYASMLCSSFEKNWMNVTPS